MTTATATNTTTNNTIAPPPPTTALNTTTTNGKKPIRARKTTTTTTPAPNATLPGVPATVKEIVTKPDSLLFAQLPVIDEIPNADQIPNAEDPGYLIPSNFAPENPIPPVNDEPTAIVPEQSSTL